MATETIVLPNITFGFYYGDLYASLLEYKRTYVPELTDESDREPSIQFLRAQALVGHENSCVLDMIAQESLLATSRLAESVREHLRQIDYEMSPARPAKVDLVCQLTKAFAAPSVVVPFNALFSTQRDPTTGVTIYFETDDSVSVGVTTELSKVLASEAGVYTDFTTEANSPTSPADDWQPWANPNSGDAVYFGHEDVMWNRLDVFVTTEVSGDGFGVWEYYSGDYAKDQPDSVTQVGSRLRMVVDGYLGSSNRAGTEIRVQINSTTNSEDVVVFWTGSNNVIETVGLLGQSAVSLDATDYTIGSAWEPLPDLASTSELADLYFGIEDEVSWTLPQSIVHRWDKVEIEGTEAYWMRFRWIEAPATSPVVQYVTIENAQQFVSTSCTQGRTIVELLGSSTGAASQVFEASQSNFIEGPDELLVDSLAWTRVSDFVLSGPQDEHYVVTLTGSDDRPLVKFGDGTRGKIPPVGVSNIEWEYRYGAQNDGNAGANTITVDRSSLSFVDSIFNPRQAFGWSAAEGSTEQSLELAKQIGPATLRAKDVALSTADLVSLALRFIDENGAKPYRRAFAIEEGFGPKTVELVVVRSGGGLATTPQLDELALFFNGDKFSIPPIESHFICNQEVTATNYTPRIVNVKVKVWTSKPIASLIENRLRAVFNPEATKADGSFEWEFGGEIARSRIHSEIHGVSASISKVEIIEPAGDISLSFRQLPTIGTVSVEIV